MTPSKAVHAKRKIFFRNREGYLYLLPTLIVLVCVFVIPLGFSLILSFMKWNYLDLSSSPKFIGLQNYIDILTDRHDMNSFRITGIFVVCSVSLEMLLGIIIALMLNTERRGVKLCRTLVLMPMLISDVVVALCWRYILQADFGVVNSVLKTMGLSSVMWTDAKHALSTIIMVEVWQHTGFVAMMVLSGLQGVPVDQQEAAIVDGAGYFQRLFHVTLPFIKPQILLALIFRTMFGIRVFTQPWVLTGGGPADKTNVLGISIYKYGFRYYKMGIGNAMAWLMIIGTLVIVIIYINMMREDEEAWR